MARARLEVLNKEKFSLNRKYEQGEYIEGQLYLIEFPDLDVQSAISFIKANAADLFYETITQQIVLSHEELEASFKMLDAVDLVYRPGVTDNVAKTVMEAISFYDLKAQVTTGNVFYPMKGNAQDLKDYVSSHVGNILIQQVSIASDDRFGRIDLSEVKIAHKDNVEIINLEMGLEKLIEFGKDRCLALSQAEWECIISHYKEIAHERAELGLPTNITDVEIEIIAQTWSEHCKHKIFSADINYTETYNEGLLIGNKEVKGLFKSYIKKVTDEIKSERNLDWLVSVFTDNAGIVRFDNNVDVCFKVETHNSPSALDPYGGALTGILGVNRDILGCGMGARPIANTDVFCFPPLELEELAYDDLPKSVMPPRRILKGVHKGVEDGGNKSGIPTVNGAIVFDESYAGKPLVYVGTVGVMPQTINGQSSAYKKALVGDYIIVAGGAVGADGIHGATFSSMELNDNAPATAVQIGDPITQKRLGDFLLVARDRGLYHAVTDNGAGGLSSSVGEMSEDTNGATLYVERIPLKYPGLSPWEVIISESQERMTFAVSAANKDAFLKLAKQYGVSANHIGEFNDSGKLRVVSNGKIVADLSMHFLHEGLPKMKLKANWSGPKKQDNPYRQYFAPIDVRDDLANKLKKMMGRPNIASKEDLVRQYDHEVQAATHIKPFVVDKSVSPSDGGVVWMYPHGGEKENGLAVACGLHPFSSEYDAYHMAIMSVDECLRNLISSGGQLAYTAILDNFCWPDPIASENNPEGEYRLAQLVRANQGLYDICKVFGIPLISGKDSMKNDYKGPSRKGEKLDFSVLPTLLVSGISKVTIGKTVPNHFTLEQDVVLKIGYADVLNLRSSEFSRLYQTQESTPAQTDLKVLFAFYQKVEKLIANQTINSIHDVSDGGVLCSLTEMCFAKKLGVHLNDQASDVEFFGEGAGHFVISCSAESLQEVKAVLSEHIVQELGVVQNNYRLNTNNEIIDLDVIYGEWSKGVANETHS